MYRQLKKTTWSPLTLRIANSTVCPCPRTPPAAPRVSPGAGRGIRVSGVADLVPACDRHSVGVAVSSLGADTIADGERRISCSGCGERPSSVLITNLEHHWRQRTVTLELGLTQLSNDTSSPAEDDKFHDHDQIESQAIADSG